MRWRIPSIFPVLFLLATVCAPGAEDASSGLDSRQKEELQGLMVALAPVGEPGFENPQTDILSLLAFRKKAIFDSPHDDAMPSDVRRKAERRFNTLLNETLDRLDLAALEKLVRKVAHEERLYGTIGDYFSQRWIMQEVALICADKNLRPSLPPRSYQPTPGDLTRAHFELGARRGEVDDERLRFIAQLLNPHSDYFTKADSARVGPRPIQSECDLKQAILQGKRENGVRR